MKVEYTAGGLLIFVAIFSIVLSKEVNPCEEEAAARNVSQLKFQLMCQRQNLTRFPVFASDRIKVLNLQYNRIKVIQSDSLNGYSVLIKLNISGNAIKRVEDRAFDGGNRLETLDLSNNMISDFGSTGLGESLLWLSISRNSLRKMPDNLRNLKNLKHLDLSNNHFITRISEASLPSSLLELNLRFTSIKYFTQATFSGLADLKTLYLSDNMGSSSLRFSTRPFDELESLEYLDLSRSFCRRLRTDSFMALRKLKVLHMNSCWLAAPPQLYRGSTEEENTNSTLVAGNTSSIRTSNEWYNPQLESLDLSNNRRLTIKSSFHLPSTLKEVSLSHSKILSVDVPVFTKGSAAHFLDLSYSGVTSLCDDAISNAGNLTLVVLTGNPITKIPKIPKSLQILNMSKTSVTNITNDVMATAYKLEEIRVDQAQIEHIEDFTFRNMSSLQKLDLSQNKLQKITRNTLLIGSRHRRALVTHKGQSHLLEVNISSNALTRISRKAFASHSHLRVLDLSDNIIQSLDIKQFDGLRNVVELYLQKNRIVKIEARAFAGLPNLKILHLDNNHLDFINDGTFTNLPSLTHIYLQNNRIQKRVHFRTSSLQYIDLSNNSIQKIPKLTPQIRTLKASFNEITSLPSSAFAKATRLEVLEVNSCFLQSINFSVFNKAHSLKTLSITDNFLFNLVDVEMPSLENLYMSSNQIDHVSGKLLKTLPSLKTLDLRFNNISHINPVIFDGLNKLDTLYLSGNNFVCDCNLYDFVQWLARTDEASIVTDSKLYQCEKPEEEYAMPVLDVVKKLSVCKQTTEVTSEAALTSPPPPNAHNTIILASCIAVLLLLGFCVAYAVAKKWSLKIKLKVKDNNNKHLRGKAVKCDANAHTGGVQNFKVT